MTLLSLTTSFRGRWLSSSKYIKAKFSSNTASECVWRRMQMNDQQSERQKKNVLQRALAFSSRADQLVSQDCRGLLGPGLSRARFIFLFPLFSLLPLKSVYLRGWFLGNCWLWPENMLWLIRTPPCPSKVHSCKLWKNTTVSGQHCIPQSWKSTTTMLCTFMGWRPLGKQGLILCKPKKSFFRFGSNTLWPLTFRCESGWSGSWSLEDAGEPLALREVRTIRQGFGNSESQSEFRVEINAARSIVLSGCWWFVV